ncbi:MAG: hypothetical protein GF393_12765 [Armatimonadia bacterium]|nr:hypothetical protein [Armatimonadia bacterium]
MERRDFVMRYRRHIAGLVYQLQQIELLNDEYARVDYGTLIQDADFADSDTLTKATFVNTVANTEQILTGISDGMWTNLYSTRGT